MMTRRKLAFVLAGGGARGALQAGALRALYEAGYRPDLVTGTSIGAINAAILARRGFTPAALDALESAWRHAAHANLTPNNYVGLTLRALLGRGTSATEENIRAFLIAQGITCELTFGELSGVPIRIVAADLRSGQTVIYGANSEEHLLEAVLASAAIPPWVEPLKTSERLLLDGGAVSNLPIEPALRAGATEIIALDLTDPRPPAGMRTFGSYAFQLLNTVHLRQAELELALAEAHHVPVWMMRLRCVEHPVSLWDFSHTPELIEEGYTFARAEIAGRQAPRRGVRRLRWLRRST